MIHKNSSIRNFDFQNNFYHKRNEIQLDFEVLSYTLKNQISSKTSKKLFMVRKKVCSCENTVMVSNAFTSFVFVSAKRKPRKK